MEQPFRTREQEDDLCGKLILAVTAYECGIFNKVSLVEFLTSNGLDSKDILEISDTITNNNLSSLIEGSIQNVMCLPQKDGSIVQVTNVPIHLLGQYTEGKPKLVSLPGSFNPLHPGHTSSLDKAVAINATKNATVCGFYELSVSNVDKQPMTIQELTKRLGHFSMQKYPLFLTNAPRFVDKAAQYPGIDYVMGVDTVIRLVDKTYTDNNQEKMILLLKEIVDKGTRFFVLPRVYGVANISPSFRVHLEIDQVLTYPMINFAIPTILLPYFTEIEDNEYKGLAASCIRNSLVKSCIA
jgi:glycerol-3-phosphate cytidylyltransferase-like family protein